MTIEKVKEKIANECPNLIGDFKISIDRYRIIDEYGIRDLDSEDIDSFEEISNRINMEKTLSTFSSKKTESDHERELV